MPPLSIILDTLLYAVLPALLTAAVVMAVLVRLGASHAASALGLASGAAVGLWLRDAWTVVPGASAWNRLPWMALAALWIGGIARLPALQPISCWILRTATAAAAAWLVIPAEARREADWLPFAGAALIIAYWAILEPLATELPDGSVSVCLALVVVSAGVVLLHAGSARYMDAAVVLASALVGVAGVAWWSGSDAGSVIPGIAIMLPGLLLAGKLETFSEVPWQAFALPAVAPLLLAEIMPLTSWQGARRQLCRLALMLVLMLVPLVIALLLARAAGALDFGM